jgi:hypothetical protein
VDTNISSVTYSRIWSAGVASQMSTVWPVAIQSFSFYVPSGSNTWFAQMTLSQAPSGNSDYIIGPLYYLP